MTTKTEASDKTSRPSPTDRFRAVGAERSTSLAEFSPFNIVTAADSDSPAFPEAQAWRYSRENPAMQKLMETIRVHGLVGARPPLLSQIKGKDPATVYAKAGNRLIMACRYLIEDEAIDPKGEKITNLDLGCRMKFGDSMEAFLQVYRTNNRNNEGDDVVTVAQQMRRSLDGDDENGLAPLAIEQVCAEFNVGEDYLSAVTDPVTGLIALSNQCKEAVAQGEISEKMALAIAQAKKNESDQSVRHEIMDCILETIGERSKAGEKTTAKDITHWIATGNIGAKKRRQKRDDAPVSMLKLRKLYSEVANDKVFDDMSAKDLLAILCNEDGKCKHQMGDSLRLILDEASKPGRKGSKKEEKAEKTE